MNYWQRKLLAFLHDPPHKALDIPGHEENRMTFARQAGFTEPNPFEWFDRPADWWASAADRFPAFKSNLRSPFGGTEHPFKHPLGEAALPVKEFPSPELLGEALQATQPGTERLQSDITGEERDRINFFLHWRRWPVETAQKEWRSAFQPADTRLPDHPIWLHNSITSALQGCGEKPALLLLQLGPVQDFIAQARSTRDLWSGSYLLSWLICHAIKAVTDRVGPDSVIFPFLRAQPLFDLLHRDEIYEKVRYTENDETMWDRLKVRPNEIVVPNMPNRFLALVPADEAESLAKEAESAIRKELANIATACWSWLDSKESMNESWRTRFDAQIKAFPQVTWQTLPWEASVDKALADFGTFGGKAASDLEKIKELGSPFLFNAGFMWPHHFAQVDRLLAARKNTRDFDAWMSEDTAKSGASKDTLSGKEEIIGTAKDWWERVRSNKDLKHLFRSGDMLGAINLVKRTWHRAYLAEEKELKAESALKFESAPDIAAGCWRNELPGKIAAALREDSRVPAELESLLKTLQAHAKDWGFGAPEEEITLQNIDTSLTRFSPGVFLPSSWKEKDGEEKAVIDALHTFYRATKLPKPPTYVAVLALDGDDMGRWLSGEKTPPLAEQFSKEAREEFGAKLEGIRRPLSPSYHLQFSEALANFSLYLAGPIVEHFGGQLIYAGGDDVLAMLPAAQALECAQALRRAFQGKEGLKDIYKVENTGFVELARPKAEQPTWPLIVPGPRADASCGIAYGHIKSPLQGLVRAARQAEKKAKDLRGEQSSGHRSGAFSLALYKRSGEIVEWGARWEGGAIDLFDYFIKEDEAISGKFAYALHDLLAPYNPASASIEDAPDFDAKAVIDLELARVLDRQVGKKDVRAELAKRANAYIEKLSDKHALTDLPLLFRAATFILRGERA